MKTKCKLEYKMAHMVSEHGPGEKRKHFITPTPPTHSHTLTKSLAKTDWTLRFCLSKLQLRAVRAASQLIVLSHCRYAHQQLITCSWLTNTEQIPTLDFLSMGKYHLHFSEDPVIYTGACLCNESPGMEPIIGTRIWRRLYFPPPLHTKTLMHVTKALLLSKTN